MDNNFNFETTEELDVSDKIIDQVIGQDEAVNVIRKAADQRRHVLLIGDPGTGKSMLGMALAELLPESNLTDILSYPNPHDENEPLIEEVEAGEGRTITDEAKVDSNNVFQNQNLIFLAVIIASVLLPYYFWQTGAISDVIYAASMITSVIFIVGFMIFLNVGAQSLQGESDEPKLIVDNADREKAPFFDATGSHAGALLGDVLHDPFQSGGLGTPANKRVVAGMIHKAHNGVLFIDEIGTLDLRTQQELLSAIQEKEFPITGQSKRSAGAMVRTEPVPCDFVLVAAGNASTMKQMHPALRSRVRGYGYEVFMNDTIKDNELNRERMAQFVAQEVEKDEKIPHFTRDAVNYIIKEARRKANRKNHMTLRLRNLGGIVRAAGDIAKEEKENYVKPEHVAKAKEIAGSLEKQMADKHVERKKEYEVIVTEGERTGRVNGLAVIGSETGNSGILLPIESEVTPGGKGEEITATGKLGEIATEAIKNVRAIIMNYFGEDIREKNDLFVQFLQTYEGVEGDSASIAVATAIISAFKDIPVRQDTAMTGSLSIRGEVLPVGGVTSKVEAAVETGIKRVIVPKSNEDDIILDDEDREKIEIIPVETIGEVLEEALNWEGHEEIKNKIR